MARDLEELKIRLDGPSSQSEESDHSSWEEQEHSSSSSASDPSYLQTPAQLQYIAELAREALGISSLTPSEIRDRKWLKKNFRDCWVGREFVDWILEEFPVPTFGLMPRTSTLRGLQPSQPDSS